jgi:hypothetical protein
MSCCECNERDISCPTATKSVQHASILVRYFPKSCVNQYIASRTTCTNQIDLKSHQSMTNLSDTPSFYYAVDGSSYDLSAPA